MIRPALLRVVWRERDDPGVPQANFSTIEAMSLAPGSDNAAALAFWSLRLYT